MTRLESGAHLLSAVGRVTLRYTQCFKTKASSAPVRGLLAVERLMGLHGYDNRGGIRVKKVYKAHLLTLVHHHIACTY